jgi:hypothetical protein
MTDIAGRLSGVTILLVEGRPFLRGYINQVLHDAGAIVVGPVETAHHLNIATCAVRARVACLDLDPSPSAEALLGELEARRIPYLMLLTGPHCDGSCAGSPAATLKQPFAGFQIVDALQQLATTRR